MSLDYLMEIFERGKAISNKKKTEHYILLMSRYGRRSIRSILIRLTLLKRSKIFLGLKYSNKVAIIKQTIDGLFYIIELVMSKKCMRKILRMFLTLPHHLSKDKKKGIKRPNIKKQLKGLKTVKRFYDNKIIASEQCKDHWL